ncbi:Gmad2 immunoglobulin-like domain-containing protein [Amycolatopsis mongoliensis]|uniref:Gmad2 immunoglobulin-like domain-containing protein n=1 Tax=Amycolatopsis mongoliensis TaxID=715475 RepID=A0A9Y2JL34_9PSEU|nr:Gmad2 immunoglobulin-like domain-containing protein [Amycolatopsis sp. 4-36]WIY00500.1 Gmad2 immunoglobulin-like domain-containing protein [Amycolatopsis sp. 4-36]
MLRDRRRMWTMIGALAGVLVVVGALVIGVLRDRPATPAGPPGAPATTTAPSAPVTTVEVFFHRGQADDPARVEPVRRTVPKTDAVATAAVAQLLGGPTAAERGQGYFSMFGPATAGKLKSVRVANGVAHADFRDFRQLIPNATSSFGSAALLAELDATLGQFATVKSTVYSFDGNVTAFYEWLQRFPPIGDESDVKPAMAAARQFLTGIAGMTNPADGPFARTGTGRAEATFYARSPEGKPVPQIATVVSLRRSGTAWSVTGTTTGTIRVDVPATAAAIASPLHVSGRALAFEGVVTVRVVEDRANGPAELGRGSVVGGGDQLRPFAGDVPFTAPAGNHGWVVFTELSAADGTVIRATSVRVGFAGRTATPAVELTSWNPALQLVDGWLRLPDGAGSITFTAKATGADRVEVTLTPAGTGTAPLKRVLGTATRAGDVYTFTWAYADEPLLGHLGVLATGPGGATEVTPFGLYHG